MTVSTYSFVSFAGYILFYVGSFMALPAVFKNYSPPEAGLEDIRYTPDMQRLGMGLLIFIAGGILQVLAESFWGYLFCF
jgi:hypothetical protein